MHIKNAISNQIFISTEGKMFIQYTKDQKNNNKKVFKLDRMIAKYIAELLKQKNIINKGTMHIKKHYEQSINKK